MFLWNIYNPLLVEVRTKTKQPVWHTQLAAWSPGSQPPNHKALFPFGHFRKKARDSQRRSQKTVPQHSREFYLAGFGIVRNPAKHPYPQEDARTYWRTERASGAGGGCRPPGCLGQKVPPQRGMRKQAPTGQPPSATSLVEAGPHVAPRQLAHISLTGAPSSLLLSWRRDLQPTPPARGAGSGEHGWELLSPIIDWLVSVAVGVSLQPCCPIGVPALEGEPGVGREVHALATTWSEIQLWSLNGPPKTPIPSQIKCIHSTNISVTVCSKYTLSS